MSVSSALGAEERVEVRRYLDALRRNRWLIALIVVGITGTVLILSLTLPDTYRATARVVLQESTLPFGETDAASTERRLATTGSLLTTPEVLTLAARRVPGATPDELDSAIESDVDPEANIIEIEARDRDPERAARMANAVTNVFLNERAELERARIQRAREQLEQEITRLEGTGSADVEIAAIRERISELTVSEGSAGADLQLAERARPDDEPTSPRPLRNTVLAFFGALFLAILIALGRDQLVPRVSSARELGRLLDVPVLATVPYVRGRLGRRRSLMSGAEVEAYGTLRAALELVLPPDRRHMILVTGAMHAEGKTTAAARLGRALAQNGKRVLIVSADLRVPRLHEMFGLPLGVGLANILVVVDWEAGSFDEQILERGIQRIIEPGNTRASRGLLDVITSGTKPKDPGRLITGPASIAFLDYLRTLDYDVVLLDAPPLLGIADSQVLASHVDQVLLVNRLDRVTLEHATELREVIDRLPVKPLGMVVIGGRGEISPYYMARRPGLVREEEASA